MSKESEPSMLSKPSSRKRKKLGEMLVQAGLIQPETLEKALALQKDQNKKIGQLLMDMGFVDGIAFAVALSEQLNLPFVRLKDREISASTLEKVPQKIVEKYSLIPIETSQGKLVVATANPLEPSATDDLQFVTQMPIQFVVSPLDEIEAAIEKFYPTPDIEPDIEKDLESGFLTPGNMEIVQVREQEDRKDKDLLNLAGLPPVVRFTNSVIAGAIRMRASDIHIEPQEKHLVIRFRVDGMMRETMRTGRHVHASLVSRIKVISGLDISVRRRPQDGKAQVNFGGEKFDLRTSTIPTSYGEKVTIRILRPATTSNSIDDLGFSGPDLQTLMEVISRPQGIMLVTGPTGSGKSTTLYACLGQLNRPSVNIVTVEDPVEFDIEGINQVQINAKAGITFATGLRSILRQDPDIVMVGEIRDKETASVAFQAAQTGHLVLSTLHTNDAPSAITRLLDLDVDAFQVSDALLAVVAQRLVRRVHEACKVPDPLDPQIRKRIAAVLEDSQGDSFWKGAGCANCLESGYFGRIGIYEVLFVTPTLKRMIVPDVSAQTIQEAAEKEGFRSLTRDGLQKACQGLTTIEEVLRVAPPSMAPGALPEVVPPSAEFPAPGVTEPEAGAAASALAVPTSDETADRVRTILVVDDSEETLDYLQHVLESGQYTVYRAENGQEALRIVETTPPGLIVTDYRMPGMDGMALIRALKSKETSRRIPIIMLTATDDVEAEVEIIDAGADDYLTKPVHAERLLARVGRFFKKRKKIIIVDDNRVQLQLLQRMLGGKDFAVVTTESGQEATKRIPEEKPDLIITDLYMPGMDGMALIREIKSDESTRHIPVIVLTAEDEVQSEIEIFDAGADDYLTKPVNAKRLVSRVNRLLKEDR